MQTCHLVIPTQTSQKASAVGADGGFLIEKYRLQPPVAEVQAVIACPAIGFSARIFTESMTARLVTAALAKVHSREEKENEFTGKDL